MTDTAVDIERLTYADLPQVIAIERRAFLTPWSLAMFVLELSKTGGNCLKAQRDGRVAGYVVCSPFDDAWHLMNIAVAPELRGTGVGDALMETLIAQLGPGARLTLEVRPTNAPAIALYERHGFLAAGRRRGYYQDNGEDALIMWRTPATLEGRLDDVPNPAPQQLP